MGQYVITLTYNKKFNVMKTIVKLLFLPVLLLSTTGLSRCGKEEVQSTKVSIEPCKDTVYDFSPSHFFDSIDGTVVERKRNSTSPVLYYIDAPATYKNTIHLPLYPCNMPESVKQDGLKVKVSGHLLTFPGEELLNREAYDFELSSLEILTID